MPFDCHRRRKTYLYSAGQLSTAFDSIYYTAVLASIVTIRLLQLTIKRLWCFVITQGLILYYPTELSIVYY